MFNMKSKFYDKLNFVSRLIPLIITFLGAVLPAYNLTEQVLNIIMVTVGALGTLLNGILEISSKSYYKGKTEATSSEPIEDKGAEPEPKINEPIIEEPIIEPSEEPVEDPAEEQEPIVEPVEEPQPSCSCEAGKGYILLANLRVRDGASVDARQKRRDELSADGQAHSIEQEMATLLEGTQVSCLEVQNNFIRIPSGWICAELDGEVFVKEYVEPVQVQAIRNQLSKYTDPWRKGFYNMCEMWVRIVYQDAGFPAFFYCCANHNRDVNAQGGDPENGHLVFSGSNFYNIPCEKCGRQCGHVGIYMDGFVYGSQEEYRMTFAAWTAKFGYGGHSNLGNW